MSPGAFDNVNPQSSFPAAVASASKLNAPRVIIVDEELPFPTNTGKRIRTYQLVSRLVRDFRIEIVCHRSEDADEFESALSHFADLDVKCHVLSRRLPQQSVLSHGWKYYAAIGQNLLSRRPYLVDKHDSSELREAIHSLERSGNVDLWHCEWTPYAAPFLDYCRRPWVVAAHNVESQIWQRYADYEQNAVRRWYIRHQCHKFRSFEQRVFREASSTIVVSDADAALARRWFDAKSVRVVENGVDLEYFHPSASQRDTREILYIGSLDWRPNLDAVLQLLDSVFPKLRSLLPDARLTIVGRKPPTWLVDRVQREPSVSLHADVPDVRPYLWRSALLVVPLRIGGGSRLKILEALATETPVLSTAVGAEGLKLVPGRDYVQSEIDNMAKDIVHAIGSPALLAATAEAGRTHVAANHSWDTLAGQLGEIWRASTVARDHTYYAGRDS